MSLESAIPTLQNAVHPLPFGTHQTVLMVKPFATPCFVRSAFCHSSFFFFFFFPARAEPVQIDLDIPGPQEVYKCAEEVVLHLYKVRGSQQTR